MLLDVADGLPDDPERTESVLAKASAEELRGFLRTELTRRPELREHFLAYFGNPLAKDAEAYRAEVDRLFEEHVDEYPVVEAIDFSRFTDLAEAYREHGEYE